MGLVLSGAGGAAGKTLVDVVETWSGSHTSASGNPQGQGCDARVMEDLTTNSGLQLFPSISGAIGGIGYNVNVGRVTHTWVSLAAISTLGNNATVGSGWLAWGWPIWRRFSLPLSVPAAFEPIPYRRYRVDYLVQVNLLGAADVFCGVVNNNANAGITGGAADPFVGWCARSVLNGGRWTPRLRLTGGGGFVDGPDSGVAAVSGRLLQASVIYEQGPTPRIRWLLNGREVHQIAGDLNMPGTLGAAWFLAKAMGAGAGVSSADYAETRFRIDEIG